MKKLILTILICALLLPIWASANIYDSALTGWWTLDNVRTVSNIVDSSGNNRTGFLKLGTGGSTATTSAPAVRSQGLNFDGIDDYILVDNPGNIFDGGYVTVSAWVKPDDYDSLYPRIVDRVYNGQFAFYFNYATLRLSWALVTVGGSVDRGSNSLGAAVPLNKWSHAVFTWDGTTAKTYLNGVVQDQLSAGLSGGLGNSTSNIAIGQRIDVGTSRAFDGVLDDVRLYTRALSANEVSQLYYSTKGMYGRYY